MDSRRSHRHSSHRHGIVNTNNNDEEQNMEDDQPVVMHQMEHRGIKCNICDSQVSGFRYKCLQCPEFDLCPLCERKGHHAGHVMMRIAFPEQSKEAIKRYCHGVAPQAVHIPSPKTRCSLKGRKGSHGQGWSEFIRKAAGEYVENIGGKHSRRSRRAGAEDTEAAGAEGSSGINMPPFNVVAAVSQIQDLLNSWGVPINIVNICRQLGITLPTQFFGQAAMPNAPGIIHDTHGPSGAIPTAKNPTPAPKTKPPQKGATTETFSPTTNVVSNQSWEDFLNSTALPSKEAEAAATSTLTEKVPIPPIGATTATDLPEADLVPPQYEQATGLPSFEYVSAASSLSDEDRNSATLNQLLSMGFSNHDGWLQRLVAAKKGDLEAVLNSLFPGGAPSPST